MDLNVFKKVPDARIQEALVEIHVYIQQLENRVRDLEVAKKKAYGIGSNT